MIPVAPPSIQGVSAFGGFQFEMLDLVGGDIGQLAECHAAGGGAPATSRAAWPGLFSAFTANDPQLLVTIDRDKARASACRYAKSPTRSRCCSGRST